MYTEDNEGNVVLTISRNDYNTLLLCLGFAAGSAIKEGTPPMAHSFLKLANSINVGNPDWTPYETAETLD
jgi:hypothetical protein